MDTPNLPISIASFRKKIYAYYKNNKRILPWRKTSDPYKILVSEMMLQQTQASRVIPKYKEFISVFPTVQTLAYAPAKEVLKYWQGLGYNRRALYLHRTACSIEEKYYGKFPKSIDELTKLPGVGPYTASAIRVFAYNKPEVVIETNIRAVFIHFFFTTKKKIPDTALIPLIRTYMDTKHPKEWYNALMDYGAMLKRKMQNPSRNSAHHTTQSTFEGSDRQIRGAIIREYTKDTTVTKSKLIRILPYEQKNIIHQYKMLKDEGFFD